MTITGRFYALDVLRGLAIALMVLVNTPGSWSHVYAPLLHARWDGFTFADIVFPGFLFVVGAAMAFSLKGARPDTATVTRILKRTLLMFGFGLLLNVISNPDPATLRVMGVLQRIALCYMLVALLVISVPRRALIGVAMALPLLYLGLLLQNPAPFSLTGNLVLQVDLAIFGAAHLYQGYGVAFDPEGLLSTLPAMVNVLIGYLVASQLAGKTHQAVVRQLLLLGAVLSVLALVGNWWWPVNKPLWSGTYVALSCGILLFILAALVYLVDIRQATRLTEPLRIYGTNPLLIYILSQVMAIVMAKWLVWGEGANRQSLTDYLFSLLALGLPEKLASLLFAVLHVVLFWALARYLYQRQIFLKL
jgi:predicted acyltransferase